MKAPFPWFGGKSRVASQVWEAFGDVQNYVEPFFGSGAVLLGRPGEPRIETVNDLDCYLANFWRAVQQDPDEVARHADWPVSEADLHARHLWLVGRVEFRERMKTDPEYFDAKIAGWWVWGICQWIGSGWCAEPSWSGRTTGRGARGGNTAQHGRGITRQIPMLSGDSGATGRGIHASGLAKQLPALTAGDGNGAGIHAQQGAGGAVYVWMRELSARLRRVRVCCGDWTRILGPSVTERIGVTGVFLDPPYSTEADRDPSLYSAEDLDIAHAVREWALANGENPKLRIALCGYEGEHQMPETWHVVAWKANGGYGSARRDGTNENANRERIWFSPHCLGARQQTLFTSRTACP